MGVVADLIRLARPSDARGIAQVHVAGWQQGYRGLVDPAFLEALSVGQREQGWARILGAGHRVLVHESAGQVDGFVSFGPCGDQDAPAAAGEVYALYVAPDRWGSGVGRRLLAAAVDELGGSPASEGPPVLWVLEGNRRARRFYQRQGWWPDGSRREGHRPPTGSVPGISFVEVRHRLGSGRLRTPARGSPGPRRAGGGSAGTT